MPSPREHRDKAYRNLLALQAIDHAAHPEWAAVIAFYRAVHLIELLAAREAGQAIHNGNHADRDHYVRSTHRPIAVAFRMMHDAAHTARYGTVNQFITQFPDDTLTATIIGRYLAQIEDYVRERTSPPQPRP